MTWKLRVLFEVWLTAVSSLGAGLSGDGPIGCCRWLLLVLESVLVLEICTRTFSSRVFSSELGLTLTFIRPRFEMGSNEMTRGFGAGI